jgi:hypothetical protein
MLFEILQQLAYRRAGQVEGVRGLCKRSGIDDPDEDAHRQ